MSRFELYSPEGLRVDGRRYNELRYFGAQIGTYAKTSDGSAVLEMGASKIVCTVHGPQEPRRRSQRNAKEAKLTVGVRVAPFATTERRKHRRRDMQLRELCRSLKRTFSSVIFADFAPRTEIVVTIHVFAQDGNLLASCVNGMCLALIDAGIPMREYVSAVGVAVADQTPLLDPNQIEEQELPSMTIGIRGQSSKISLLILESRLNMDLLRPALELGVQGCKLIHDIMDDEMRKRMVAETTAKPELLQRRL